MNPNQSIFYWALQGTIVEFARTRYEAIALMHEAEEEAEVNGGEVNICEYGYVNEMPVGGLTQTKQGHWQHGGNVFRGELPTWVNHS